MNFFMQCLHTGCIRATKGIIKIIRITWNLMMFTEKSFIRPCLSEGSMALMALEDGYLRARISTGLGKWDVNLRVVWDMHSYIRG